MIKKFIVFLFTSLFVFTFGLTVNASNKTDFEAEAKLYYDSYYVLYDIDNPSYELIVVKGLFNNKPSYGISFINKDGKYQLVLKQNDSYYTLKENKAIAIEASSIIYLALVTEDGVSKEIVEVENSSLQKFNRGDLDNENVVIGLGNGKDFSALDVYVRKIMYKDIIIAALISTISLCSIVILFAAIRKKGMFNKKARKDGIVAIEDLIARAKASFEEENVWGDFKYEKATQHEEKGDEIKEEYEEVKGSIDITDYLLLNGYSLDYDNLNEEEKNKIMGELIKLKNENKISLDDYYNEVYKLWKK